MKYLIILFLCAGASAFEVDLISAATCKAKLGRLAECNLGSAGHKGSGTQCSLVDLKTVVKTVTEGDCSTAFPLKVKLVPERDTKSAAEVAAVGKHKTEVRLRDHGPIGNFAVEDATKWTPHATFAPSCKVHLEILLDKADVSDAKQALLALEGAVSKINSALDARDDLLELLAHRAALHAVLDLAKLLDEQVASALGGDLSKDARKITALLKKLGDSPALRLSREEKESLARVGDFIATLDDAAANAPTEKKTKIGDYLSDGDRKLIERLAAKATTATARDRQKRLTQEAERLCRESRELVPLLEEYLTAGDREPLEAVQARCERAIE